MKINIFWKTTISILFFVLIWGLLVLIFNSNPFFPGPIEVFLKLTYLFQTGIIIPHIFASLKRTIIGFLIALLIGSFLGYLIGVSKFFQHYFTPLLEFLRPIPPIAWIPLAIFWFGIGDSSSIFIIFIAAVFPIFTNVYFGVKSMPKVYHKISLNFKLNFVKKFKNIILPYTTPYLITGCKTSIGFSWMAVIAAEMIAGNYGLGYFLDVSRRLLNVENVIAIMIIIGFIGYLMHKLINYIETRIVHWS